MIKVETREDWKKITDEGLRLVMDPMVLRYGELFLKGCKDSDNKEEVFKVLSVNTESIGMFFDTLVLNERIPVFNYGFTFDMMLNFDQRTLTKINDYDPVLYDVDVNYSAYGDVKDAALDELVRLYEGPNKILESKVEQILKELDVLGYSWKPDIGFGRGQRPYIDHLESILVNENEKSLAAYLLGGLIFNGYAQLMESERILQPKRSKIMLELALNQDAPNYTLENVLFSELKKRAEVDAAEIPWVPTFFPYLLNRANSPEDILKDIVKLRKSSSIREYRQWIYECKKEFIHRGIISIGARREVKSIAKHIDRIIGEIPSSPKFKFKLTLAEIGKIPCEIDLTPSAERLWGWFLQSLPGRRYQKILTRAIISQRELKDIKKSVSRIWNNTAYL